jgi:hypothetical protein
MLAVNRATNRGYGRGRRGGGQAFLANGARQIGAFVLARPGTIALTLLFGGLGLAVSANALWMQSAHHPAPLFRQAALQQPQPPLPPVRKVIEEQAAAPAAPAAEGLGPAVLPPPRPADLGRATEPASPAPAKPASGKHPKDPIADLLGGTAPVPPAPVKPAATKAQSVDKSAARAAPAHTPDALAVLIEQTSRSR